MKYITIKDIARHLSISVSTVSRALGDDKNIRKETKEKVIEAAKRLGYRPNPVAINLKYGHTNTVGVIVPEMVTPFASRVINGIQEVLHTKNIKVIIAESGGDPEKEKENLQLMEGFMVDGIIICLCSYKRNKEEYARLQQAGMPMVFYDRIPYGLEVPQVIVGDKPNSIPSVRCTDGTSRYKYRLDGISFAFKITANGFNNILLSSFKYRLTLSE